MSRFQRATKTKINLRMALTGPSGSGKTYSGLSIATRLAALRGSDLAVIDTEHGSSKRYAHLFNFDLLELHDFNPLAYVEAIHDAQAAGYRVLLIDSLSHAWVGEGGAIDIKDREAAKSGNSFTAWGKVTPLQNQLINALLSAEMDVIGTMRSKVEYVQEGKKVTKVGMAPVQRDGFEYEFDVVGDLSLEHVMSVSKTRFAVLDKQTFKLPGDAFAQTVFAELEDGAAAPPPAPAEPALLQDVEAVKATLSSLSSEEQAAIGQALRDAKVESAGGLARTIATHLSEEKFIEVMCMATEPSFPGDLPDVQRKQAREKPSAIERRDKDDAKAQAEADELFGKAMQDVAEVPMYGSGAAS